MKRKSTYDYTIAELVEMGADVSVKFHHNENLNKAYGKVKHFTDVSSIKRDNYNGTYWVKVSDKKVEVTAFL